MGGAHGIAQVFEVMIGKRKNRVKNTRIGVWMYRLLVFVFCNFMWVLFRAQETTNALYVYRHAFDDVMNPQVFFTSSLLSRSAFMLLMGYIFVLAIHDYQGIKEERTTNVLVQNKVIIWTEYVLLGLVILFGSQKGGAAEFVYFQF